MHTMWKGTISFGLVNIPVKLHAATENKDVKLRQLHKECQSPIKYERVCPVCEKEVKNDEIVKAYEYAKNKFVILDEEELEELKKEETDRSVEIMDFVQLEEIDPIYFERSYYLSPNEGGSKAYTLLRKALKDTGKIGVAKMMIRSKEQLAAIRVYENTLVVETIHYPDEVRDVQDVPNVPEEAETAKKELDTAKMLIEQLTTTFDPEKYKDEYRTALLDLIEEKKNKDQTTTAKDKPVPDNVTNLMDALQASLDRAKKDKPSAKKKATTGKKTAASKKTTPAKKKARKNA
ncbi:Ku protein [Aquibacillus sp. 3ASR75-11]|uniref:Non-homologous end joining protein Ku n=1 Tax=Terrihalobacillus insolitus TaxID=2950438 RepID=A0A9X3WSW2_9BACI|nr:Ku protein [Terrihalobacillus insolitus]MDC3414594.1 Ku protein [Terrihalobacillus insolitus]MDC3425090.1 Ku protein [Terrihalobacillus insolitus]